MKLYDILTNSQWDEFNAGQQAELSRLSEARARKFFLGEDGPEEDWPAEPLAFRDKVVSRWTSHDVGHLRARVNIDSVSATVNYSEDNNYTDSEQAAINAYIKKNRSQWGMNIPRALEGYQVAIDAGIPADVALASLMN